MVLSSRVGLAPGFVLGAFFFVLTVLYVPWLADAGVAPRWAWLSVGVPALLLLHPWAPRLTFGHAPGFAFLALAALSLLWTPSPLREGLDALWQLALLAGVFALGSRVDMGPAWTGAGLGFAVNSAIVAVQWSGHPILAQITAPAGLFLNKNWGAEAAAIALVALAGRRQWWLAAAVAPTVLLGGGWAAWSGATLGLMLLFARARAPLMTLAIAVGIAFFVLPDHQGAGVTSRIAIWSDTAEALTPAGNGLGSFFLLYPRHAPRFDTTIERPEHAHNDYLEVAYELGPAGLLALACLVAYSFAGDRRAERAGLACAAVIAAASFPLHQPVAGALAALCCGSLCADRSSLRYLLARGRMALQRDPARAKPRGGVPAGRAGGGLVPAHEPLPLGAGDVLRRL